MKAFSIYKINMQCPLDDVKILKATAFMQKREKLTIADVHNLKMIHKIQNHLSRQNSTPKYTHTLIPPPNQYPQSSLPPSSDDQEDDYSSSTDSHTDTIFVHPPTYSEDNLEDDYSGAPSPAELPMRSMKKNMLRNLNEHFNHSLVPPMNKSQRQWK